MDKDQDAHQSVTQPVGATLPPQIRWGIRLALVVLGLAAWFGTQAMIGARGFPEGGKIGDLLLDWSAPANEFLRDHPPWADGLLIVSSALIDGIGIFLLARSIFGPTMRPFLGLLILFGLRQICQGLCALPPPDGIIWRYPGFPSLLVTYEVANDFFFSGHTAIAVFGAVELARLGVRWLVPVAFAIALFQAAVVLVLRAHYTMDVFAGAVTALMVALIVNSLAPLCDKALARAFAGFRAR
jgi:hypothetical protein